MFNWAERTKLGGKWLSRLGEVRRAPQTARLPAEQQRPTRACQSLCLRCDARAPCSLGRLIG
jgi:hypothetical protein